MLKLSQIVKDCLNRLNSEWSSFADQRLKTVRMNFEKKPKKQTEYLRKKKGDDPEEDEKTKSAEKALIENRKKDEETAIAEVIKEEIIGK